MTVHDDVLEAVFLDERALDEPGVREHLAGCGACRERLDGLARLARGLDGAAAEEREDLSAALTQARSGERLDPRFEALLERHRVHASEGAPPARPVGPRPLLVRALVAAAAVIALVLVGRELVTKDGDADGRRGDAVLGGAERAPIELVSTQEDLAQGLLRWSFNLPPGGFYSLRIEVGSEGGDAKIVVDERVDRNRWSPSDSVLPVELPAAFVLHIRAYDAEEQELDSLEVRWP